jgi:hypothetical protein
VDHLPIVKASDIFIDLAIAEANKNLSEANLLLDAFLESNDWDLHKMFIDHMADYQLRIRKIYKYYPETVASLLTEAEEVLGILPSSPPDKLIDTLRTRMVFLIGLLMDTMFGEMI